MDAKIRSRMTALYETLIELLWAEPVVCDSDEEEAVWVDIHNLKENLEDFLR